MVISGFRCLQLLRITVIANQRNAYTKSGAKLRNKNRETAGRGSSLKILDLEDHSAFDTVMFSLYGKEVVGLVIGRFVG